MTSNELVVNEIQDRNMVFTPLLRNQLLGAYCCPARSQASLSPMRILIPIEMSTEADPYFSQVLLAR
jgi:hypothetical protein